MYRGDKKGKGGVVAGSRSRQEVFAGHYGRKVYEFRPKKGYMRVPFKLLVQFRC